MKLSGKFYSDLTVVRANTSNDDDYRFYRNSLSKIRNMLDLLFLIIGLRELGAKLLDDSKRKIIIKILLRIICNIDLTKYGTNQGVPPLTSYVLTHDLTSDNQIFCETLKTF